VAQAPVEDARAFLEFAVDLAEQAGRLIQPYFQTALDVELKADHSPVTVADRGAERLIRDAITGRYPTHAIVGEEFGDDRRDASHRWFIDPIDGTRSFVHGVPLFGVLLGLQVDGRMIVGVCHLPALGDTFAAARGLGCTWNGRVARVSTTSTLSEATLVYSDSRLLARRLATGWETLQASTRLQRGWGDCYGHCLVATGRADAMLDSVMNPWDCAALVPIVEESGGRFTDWRGDARVDGGDAVSTNGHLHAEILRVLGSGR
jgi:histidinol phosphatase-like enzyme (inositol monophosphatase family)